VTLVGPVGPSTAWQSKAGGFDSTMFTVDWEHEHVTCPAGKTSTQWARDRSQTGIPVVRARFSPADCRACPLRERCTKGRQRLRTPDHAAPAGRARSAPAGEDRAEHPAMATPLRTSGRHRRNHLPGCECLRAAPLPLPRTGQDQTPAPTHRRRDEPRPSQRLAHRHAPRTHTNIPLRSAPPRRITRRGGFANSVREGGGGTAHRADRVHRGRDDDVRRIDQAGRSRAEPVPRRATRRDPPGLPRT
jgi:hypothetical protein